jgi:hypothetical protein
MSSLAKLSYYDVERQACPGNDNSWYQVMLAPFKTFEECLQYIKKYSQYYPPEYRNYRVLYKSKTSVV